MNVTSIYDVLKFPKFLNLYKHETHSFVMLMFRYAVFHRDYISSVIMTPTRTFFWRSKPPPDTTWIRLKKLLVHNQK